MESIFNVVFAVLEESKTKRNVDTVGLKKEKFILDIILRI